MAKHLGEKLNDDLLAKLRRGELYRTGGLALPIVVNDGNGWPHLSIAPGAVASSPEIIWTAMGGRTNSLAHVRRDPKVTLIVAGPETLYSVKGLAEPVDRPMTSLPGEVPVRVRVTEVIQDMPPYVTMTGGVSYSYRQLQSEAAQVMQGLLDELSRLAEEMD